MKAYKIIKSNIHRKGLCAARNIKKGERIIEYKGKKITHKQADEDTKYGYDITYLFTLNKKYVLDGDFKFNTARLINHSCNPNCEVLEENNPVLWITAMKDIKKMKNCLMTMDLALIVITKIIFVNVDLKIVLALLLERALDGEYLIFPNNGMKF